MLEHRRTELNGRLKGKIELVRMQEKWGNVAGVEREDQSLVSCLPRQQKLRVYNFFLCLWRQSHYKIVVVDQAWIYLFEYAIKEQYYELILQFYRAVFCFNIFENEFIPVMTKLNLYQSLLQFSVSHDLSEIILICGFAAQGKCIISLNSCCLIFFWKQLGLYVFFRILGLKEYSKEEHWLEIEIFCNITNILLLLLINWMHPCWIKY